jgi:Resolvase, N terminal domain
VRDRLARSTRDLLNALAAIADRKAGFRWLGDAWANTTTPRGRLMLTVLGGFGRLRERVDPRLHRRGTRAGQSAWRQDGPQAETDRSPEAEAIRRQDIDGETVRDIARRLQCQPQHDFTANGLTYICDRDRLACGQSRRLPDRPTTTVLPSRKPMRSLSRSSMVVSVVQSWVLPMPATKILGLVIPAFHHHFSI